MPIDNYQVSLKVFLKNEAEETLILQNSQTHGDIAYYDFPGGRIDVDEFRVDYETILLREIREELWEDVRVSLSTKPVAISRLENPRHGMRVFHVFFEAQYLWWDIVISDEHSSYQWVKLDSICPEEYFMSGMLEWVKNYLK